MKKYIDICLSDGLPCSRGIKGVGFGACVKNRNGSVRVCARFYGNCVSLLEDSVLLKIRGEL